jgi:hypothetical protein
MDEKPKSIWKKSFTGRTALVIWLAVGMFIIMLGCIFSALGNANQPVSSTLLDMAISAGIFLAACLFLVYVVWPLLRWLFWKHWRRTFFALACVATLVALFYAEEDWRGKHDWEKFKREWEAKGEKFDRSSIVPPAVPDDQNFALTPIVFTSYAQMLTRDGKAIPWKDRDTNFNDRLALNITRSIENWLNEPTNGYWAKGTITDLKGWQAYYRAPFETNQNSTSINEFPIAPQPQSPAQDVLLALSKFDPVIEELRQASQLPYSRFPLEWDKDDPAAILLPHLAALKRCSQVLQLRAIAELQNGEDEKALANAKLFFRLIDSVRTEPILISHLVRVAIFQITLQPIYEGLAERKWTDAQLADLDSELAKLDFLADYKLAMRGEMVFFQGGTFDYLRRHPAQLYNYFSNFSDEENHPVLPRLFSCLIPTGWFYQNQLNCARPMVEFYLPAADVKRQTISPEKIRAGEQTVLEETKHPNPNNFTERLLLPALSASAKKFSSAQSSVNLARVAIALERHRLVNGNYPDSLDALAAQFTDGIPHDVIGGQPLHYRRTDDGQFVLYSVGWNEKDDGGIVGYKEGGSAPNFEFGDWVWRYPGK